MPLAEGIYFIGSGGTVTQDPANIENPRDKFETEIYQSKPLEYGLPQAELTKGFATQGWSVMMSVWEIGSQLAAAGEELTPEAFEAAIAATENQHAFGSTPLSCADGPGALRRRLQLAGHGDAMGRRGAGPGAHPVHRARPDRRDRTAPRTLTDRAHTPSGRATATPDRP